MRILFFGTAEFAVPPLEALKKAGYEIAGVVTKPDEPAGRKLELTSPPVKVWAEKHRISVWQAEKLGVGSWELGELPEADIFIVAAYGKIIPREIFDAPKYKTLNIHPSLLPRWRGPSPIQYAILKGDAETGVTIIKLDELMDHGPIVAQTKMENGK
ncbi:MAG: methionyl-tRNA formyltransferase, partial [Candidatus Sungbacteria bacterium]|nr:methionyl-tRNA formyltransferase [Candidatus Sungbacteria bacterium]